MGQVVPSLKPDKTHIHFNFLVRKKIFVCDCMGPEDPETPCLPQTSDCTKVTQTEIINCRINQELVSFRSTEESTVAESFNEKK